MAFFDFLVPRLKILDKHNQIIPLRYTPMQEKIVAEVHEQIRDGKPIRIIVLKARQMGCSTVTEAMGYQMSIVFPNFKGLVLCHKNKSSRGLLNMTKRYYNTGPAIIREMRPTVSNRITGMAWDNGSELEIATAKTDDEGRGGTLWFLHNSEAAFYPNPEVLMGGLSQSVPRVPRSMHVIESTANGVGGWFHNFWEAAKVRDVQHVPMFFAWWQHPEYVADFIGLGFLADRPLTNLDDEEKLLAKVFYKLGMDAREIRSRLIWRRDFLRTECHGDVEYFHQEYPSNDTEAFISTGANVFRKTLVDAVYEPMRGEVGSFERFGNRSKWNMGEGNWTIFRHPARNSHYMVGGDASRARLGDYGVIQIIDRKTREQVAVYRARGFDQTGIRFAREMMMAGAYYNLAMLIPETNLSGSTVSEIVNSTYPNVFQFQKANDVRGMHQNYAGWPTTLQTKEEALGYLQAAIADGAQPMMIGRGFVLHDVNTYVELCGYVCNENGRYTNGQGVEHDDTVMALAIAMAGCHYEASALYRDGTPPAATNTLGPELDVGDYRDSHTTLADPHPALRTVNKDLAEQLAGVGARFTSTVTEQDGRKYMDHPLPDELFQPNEQETDYYPEGM